MLAVRAAEVVFRPSRIGALSLPVQGIPLPFFVCVCASDEQIVQFIFELLFLDY